MTTWRRKEAINLCNEFDKEDHDQDNYHLVALFYKEVALKRHTSCLAHLINVGEEKECRGGRQS